MMNFKKSISQVTFLVGLFFFFSLITWLRFKPWEPACLWGDDLLSYMMAHNCRFNVPDLDSHYFSPDGIKVLFEKFRFVFSLLSQLEFFLFGKNIDGYFAVNIAVHAANGLLLCLIAFHFCRNWFVSIILGIIGITARFGLFEVIQVTGIVENVALLFCLLTIFAVIKAEGFNKNRWDAKWKWIALGFAFLSFNTHERYLVLLPWLAIFFVLHRNAGKWQERVWIAILMLLMVISNILIKNIFYHARFLVGTGGIPISMNILSMMNFLSEAVLSILGINHGPLYLIGASWANFSTWIRVAAVIFASISCALVVLSLVKPKPAEEPGFLRWPIWLFLLGGLLLTPAIITVRMEQRWELASFFMLLLLIACGVGRMFYIRFWRGTMILLVLLLALSAAMIEFRVSKAFANIHLVYGERLANSIKKIIIDAHASPPGTPVVIIGDLNIKTLLIDGGFFVVYEGKYRNINVFDKVTGVTWNNYPVKTKVYIVKSIDELTDITDQFCAIPKTLSNKN